MAEDFDIGSFTWVKDEIDQSLKSVKDHFSTFLDKGSELTVLRHAQTHLYQASGALDMVGLRGCQRICSEMEKLTAKLEKGELQANAEIMQIMMQAIDASEHYLQQLLDGAGDVPLRLFPTLQNLVALYGAVAKESDLFFPDTTLRAPKNISQVSVQDEQLVDHVVNKPDYIASQRKNFQKNLLDWLNTASAESLEQMRLTIENVLQVQSSPVHKTLWWVVCAFMDTLSQDGIAKNTQVKRLCRQIDQRLRNTDDSARALDYFLREVLYFIALSSPLTERIVQVKNLFELDALLPTSDTRDVDIQEFDTTAAIASSTAVQEDDLQTDNLQITVQRIKESLKLVEKTLDAFFRMPSERQILETIDTPLSAIIAAFETLDKSLPTQLAKASANLVARFQHEINATNQEQTKTQFELLAESLSLLGFYVEELPRTRAETDQALGRALAKLELQLSDLASASSSAEVVLTAVEPTVIEPTVVEPTVVEPTVVEPTVVEPTVVEPIVVEPTVVEPELTTASGIKDKALDLELLSFYLIEARDVLANVAQQLQVLQLNAADKNALEQIRRGFHTLKGSGRTVGLYALGEVAWIAEKLLNEIIEFNTLPDAALLAFVNTVSLAFADWIDAIDEHGFVEIDSLYWQQLADDLVIASGHNAVNEQHVAEDNLLPASTTTLNMDEAVSADKELLSIFLEEAGELVLQIGNALRAWQANPSLVEYAEALLRNLHTLKGSAKTAGLADLASAAHDMEDHLNHVANKKINAKDFVALLLDLDRINTLLDGAASAPSQSVPEIAENDTWLTAGQSAERHPQFLRLRADVLDTLINESSEISISRARLGQEIQGFKQSSSDLTESVLRLREYLRELEMETESQMQSRMTHVQEAQKAFDPLEFDRFTRLQELARLMAESVNDVATIQRGLLLNLDQAQSVIRQQNRMSQALQLGLMAVRKVPFSLISERLHRIVRQTAQELGKYAELVIEGEAVEIDRSMLDKIGAPLEHLLRNAVGHGLEAPAQRKKQNKPKLGKIVLKIQHENDEIVISIEDDGAGINFQRLRDNAVRNGLVRADQMLGEQALLAFIFESGISTAADVTQISGRGVGLDAVRGDIAMLGGRIEVSSARQQGTRFSISLPITLTVSQMVLARAGRDIFALPSLLVEQLQNLPMDALAEAYRTGGIHYLQYEYPIHYLANLIGKSEQLPQEQSQTPILLLRSGAQCMALHVDEVLGNQEIAMKAIGPQLMHVPGVAGATVLADGKVVLVINPIQMTRLERIDSKPVGDENALVTASSNPVVMIVDDSLTMRKALSRILEREGFQVRTAKDGQDAMEQIQGSETLLENGQIQADYPDLILLDIEMPRMDGFEFTRILREDPAKAQIPIIIISSRTAEKHRNLAQTLGVNAFMGKPVHDEAFLAQIYECLNSRVPA